MTSCPFYRLEQFSHTTTPARWLQRGGLRLAFGRLVVDSSANDVAIVMSTIKGIFVGSNSFCYNTYGNSVCTPTCSFFRISLVLYYGKKKLWISEYQSSTYHAFSVLQTTVFLKNLWPLVHVIRPFLTQLEI